MSGFRSRLARQGITVEQFAFQFVVVLLGVYLAIFFESKAEERALQADARATLVNVLQELRTDQADIEETLAEQADLGEASAALRDLLAIASPAEEPAIDSLLSGRLAFNPTVFPRRAAYSALLSSGRFAAITSDELTLSLADLYEHHYPRLENLGELYDENYLDEFYHLAQTHWDFSGQRLIERGGASNVVLRNAAERHRVFGNAYQSQLASTLEAVRAVSDRIEAYLGR
jgi:hypothetical protein